MKSKILIVEDHPIFKMGLCELVSREADLRICGSAEDVAEARTIIDMEKPDLVIIDLSLKNSNGMVLIKELNTHHKEISVLVLSMHEEAYYAERCLLAGAKGYLNRSSKSPPFGWGKGDWLRRSRMGMAVKAAHCYPYMKLL
ncbi:MAG: hypothetical protein CSA23_04940, partial [Deltaproteobacteria bacterium]